VTEVRSRGNEARGILEIYLLESARNTFLRASVAIAPLDGVRILFEYLPRKNPITRIGLSRGEPSLIELERNSGGADEMERNPTPFRLFNLSPA